MLEFELNRLKRVANEIPNFKSISKSEIIKQYILHEDNEELREKYYAGILVRYWMYIGYTYRKWKAVMTDYDCYTCLIDTVNYVLEHRVWEKPDSSLYGDPKAPEKAMSIVMNRNRGIMVSRETMSDKRKANYNTVELDAPITTDSTATLSLFNATYEQDFNVTEHSIISYLLEKKLYVEALIVNIILNDDVVSERSGLNFSKTVETLKTLNRDLLVKEFSQLYRVSPEEFASTITKISKETTSKLSSRVRKALYILQRDETIKENLYA